MAKPDTDPYELALRALSTKERTERELSEWLRERGVEEADRLDVLVRLTESGGLDDERFARGYAEDKRRISGWGDERIREALEARGVARELIDSALGGEGEGEQLERAAALLRDRGIDCSTEPERDRALRLLARRGFPLELAYDAVRLTERAKAN
jgi:regulatory protein